MKKQRKLRGLQRKKMVAGYLFIMPFILGFLAFMVKPFLQSLYMSFCNVEISSTGFHMIFAGMANYIRAFTIDTEFNRLLVEEIAKMTYNSLAIMVFSFFVALILNQKFKGRAFVRAVFFLPVILSSGVILGIESDNSLLASVQDAIQDSIGTASITDTIQNILVTSGVGIKAFEKVFEIVDGVYDVAIASGIQIIIFLSGLQTISTSMYEAASLEGCTKWECLWKVTFPMISSLFLVNWVYTIIDFCMRSDNEVMEKISNTMIVDMNYGFASYALKTVIPDEPLPPVPVTLGTQATVQPVLGEENQLLLEKAKTGELSQSVTLESSVQAPVAVGDRLGTLTVTFGEEVLVELPLLAGEEVPRITFRQMLPRVLRIACLVE